MSIFKTEKSFSFDRLWDIGEHREAELGIGQRDQEKLLALEDQVALRCRDPVRTGRSWVSILTEWESSKMSRKFSDSPGFKRLRAI